MATNEPDQPGECPTCGYHLSDEEEVIKEKFKEEKEQLKNEKGIGEANIKNKSQAEEIRSNEPSRCPRCGSIISEGESEVFLSFQEEIKERNSPSYKEWLKRLR